VEDDPGDVLITQEALRAGKPRNRVHVAHDGVDALAFLRRQTPHADAPRPDLVLLDLNLPRKDGREVLAEIKSDDDLKRIPVVVLTTSRSEEDVIRSYDLHANLFITKPVELEQFLQTVSSVDEFFASVVRLPPR
jgi:two-component system, chemotaxis family, response regulator Rcp1